MNDVAVHPVVARVAAAWNDLMPSEARAVLVLASLPLSLDSRPWSQLQPDEREKIVAASFTLLGIADTFRTARR